MSKSVDIDYDGDYYKVTTVNYNDEDFDSTCKRWKANTLEDVIQLVRKVFTEDEPRGIEELEKDKF